LPEREDLDQIPTEFSADKTQNTLRKQNNVEGEKRGRTISDFPQAAALGQMLKNFNDFPADRNALFAFVEQSNMPERSELLPLVQKLEQRQYRDASEVAEAARLVQD
jgi:hypothetical protein